MPKGKLYFFDPHELSFRRAKWIRVKHAAWTLFVVAFFISALYVVPLPEEVHYFLGFRTASNEDLQREITRLSSRVKEFEGSLTRLNKDANAARLLVDLPSYDEETRMLGIGGISRNLDLTEKSTIKDAIGLLDGAIATLERELSFQRSSTTEVLNKVEENRDKFRSLPALKPIEGPYTPDSYGWRIHPVLGVRKFHEGIDIIADRGTPVYASADGIVKLSGVYRGGYGITVVLEHGYGYSTLYGHLSRSTVRTGQRVKRGDLIAYSGATGLVSGPHLHYEVIHNGVKRDPINFFLADISPLEYRRQMSEKPRK